jgi:hypothetical protein
MFGSHLVGGKKRMEGVSKVDLNLNASGMFSLHFQARKVSCMECSGSRGRCAIEASIGAQNELN